MNSAQKNAIAKALELASGTADSVLGIVVQELHHGTYTGGISGDVADAGRAIEEAGKPFSKHEVSVFHKLRRASHEAKQAVKLLNTIEVE